MGFFSSGFSSFESDMPGFTTSFSSTGSPFMSSFFSSSRGPSNHGYARFAEPHRPKKPKTKKISLPLRLEDLCRGGTRKVPVNRKLYDAASSSYFETQVEFDVKINPGTMAGTEIIFEGYGDEGVNGETGDVMFIITEVPHEKFTREGNNLLMNMTITLEEALCGKQIKVVSLAGKLLNGVTGIVCPGYEFCFPGEGMPLESN